MYKSSFHKIKSKLFGSEIRMFYYLKYIIIMSDMTIIRESARYCFKTLETYNEIEGNI